jgi:hypothetical protein
MGEIGGGRRNWDWERERVGKEGEMEKFWNGRGGFKGVGRGGR